MELDADQMMFDPEPEPDQSTGAEPSVYEDMTFDPDPSLLDKCIACDHSLVNWDRICCLFLHSGKIVTVPYKLQTISGECKLGEKWCTFIVIL